MGNHLPSRTYALVLAIFFLMMVIFAGWLLFKASGYQILQSPFRIVKTSLLDLTVHPDDQLTISLNGKAMPPNKHTLTNLSPGRYQIIIERPDYQPWETTTDLEPGEALSYPDIILFLKQPVAVVVENAEAKIYESVLSHPERFQAGLQVFGNEVWANEKLVTRYSEPVKQALWLPDNVHILIQLADSLHVVERTGGHDIILLAFAVDTPITRFAPLVGGEKLIIQSVGKLELLTITAPFGRVSFPSL